VSLFQRLISALSSLNQGGAPFATPKVTRPQQFALGQAAIVVLVVLGFNLDATTQQALIGLSAVIGAALPASDAAIRRARAQYAPQIAEASEATASSGATTLSDERARIAAALADLDRL
jgi:multidrug resistance efflux pump